MAPGGAQAASAAFVNRERTADIGVLAFGLIIGAAGALALIAASLTGHQNFRREIGVSLYAAGLIAMLGFSLLYRSATAPECRRFLRRLDHAAIFTMIAGSATPFALMRGGISGTIVLVVLWAAAVLGIIFKLRFPIGGIRRSAAFYLVLGWTAVTAVGPAFSGQTALLIVAGGALYSFGVPVLLWWRLPYRLAIWHTLVLAGAACHYAAILCAVVLA